ncbi:anaerobic ribonucleoside-triphosphate reductase activating protein [Halomonas campisalis]|uniref:Anaerobic ribonucleoside-triphosphate reductase activating protein n=1 Tax=Billgrantia campisalis TaxID=74661 RepID=A0ABS9P503_9GAMM|nr:anaerobic ribonucleoside-triphosphate reductase activating protein [Halomonas campisalis]MCG6656867.1 anaerobic ribonucleoside-triphosphate reductase activating protein [Halomonas campisalis]MDR5862056.1 anaerobic ribonucleoside-triphosphate reductase activating protein [Halomonas campisalis]
MPHPEPGRPRLPVAGFTPMTTLDYPDHLACVVFLQGCPLRCGYCHNPQMLAARRGEPAEWQGVADFLESRRGLLEAVVFSGGEPTLHAELPAAVKRAKALGFKVGLHTAGIYPQRLQALLPWLDWVGLDVKGPADDIDRIVGRRGMAAPQERSLTLLMKHGIAVECRTTVHWRDFDLERLRRLALDLAEHGATHYAIQLARTGQCLDADYTAPVPGAPTTGQVEALINELRPAFRRLTLRQ